MRLGAARVLCPPHPTGHPRPPAPVVRHKEQYLSRPHRHGHHTHSSHGQYPSSSPFSHGQYPSCSPFSHGPHPYGSQVRHEPHPSRSQFRHGPHPSSSPFRHEPRPPSPSPYPPQDQGVTDSPVPPELVDQFGAIYTSFQWGNPPPHPQDQD